MNPLHPLGALVVVGAIALGPQVGTSRPADMSNTAATYEHLANAIIAIRETENSLVRDMLTATFETARAHLDGAAAANGTERRKHLEMAAIAIGEIATEGNKQVQAVRQRLLRAGHHHHTDAETEADYIFIDGREKKAMLDLAGKVGRMGPDASQRDILAASRGLENMFKRAIAAE